MLDKAACEHLRESGYTFLSDIEFSELPSICAVLGTVTMDRRSPAPYRRISPQKIESAKENTLSSRYGTGAFPFHTDAAHWRHPPTHLMLFCEKPGSANRQTHLIDTRAWKIDDELRASMRSAIWRAGHKEPWLCTVAEENGGELAVRYDTSCMSPAGPKAERLRLQIESCIADSTKIQISWEKNSLLIINNSRLLHARAMASSSDNDRILIRTLIGGMQ